MDKMQNITLITSQIVKFISDQNRSNRSDSFSPAASERLQEIKPGTNVQKRAFNLLIHARTGLQTELAGPFGIASLIN